MKMRGSLYWTAFSALALMGCEQANLHPLEQINGDQVTLALTELATTEAEFCTLNADAVKSKMKFIFMVDKSGSNQSQSSGPGTDPDGTRRYDSILNFLQQAPEDDTISYALINFETQATALGQVSFYTRDAFKTIIQNQKFRLACARTADFSGPGCPQDGGWTNYEDAVTRTYQTISREIETAKANPNDIEASYYVGFMLTDGAPIVFGNMQSTANILSYVRSLQTLAAGENKDYVEAIQFHTLFYYNQTSDPIAEQLLKDMANEGKGDFFSVSAGEVIDFAKFRVPVRRVKHALRDVFVENVNSIWWDGQLLPDSDADTLPDSVELQLGSNPNLADSDGNDVSDGVEYRALGKPCRAVDCDPQAAETFPACAALRRNDLPNGKLYGDLDKDFLNDCEEKYVLKSSSTNWDSNRDWIPDHLAMKNGVSFVEGLSEANLDPDGDRMSTYAELKLSLPAFYPNDRINNLEKYLYALKVTSNTPEQICFRLEVNKMKVFTPHDLMRIYILENTSVIEDKRFMRIAEKPISDFKAAFRNSDLQ